jgi:hypothetical protein
MPPPARRSHAGPPGRSGRTGPHLATRGCPAPPRVRGRGRGGGTRGRSWTWCLGRARSTGRSPERSGDRPHPPRSPAGQRRTGRLPGRPAGRGTPRSLRGTRHGFVDRRPPRSPATTGGPRPPGRPGSVGTGRFRGRPARSPRGPVPRPARRGSRNRVLPPGRHPATAQGPGRAGWRPAGSSQRTAGASHPSSRHDGPGR